MAKHQAAGSLEDMYRITIIICGALVFSVLIYAGVVEAIALGFIAFEEFSFAPEDQTYQILKWALLIAAISMFPVALVVGKIITGTKRAAPEQGLMTIAIIQMAIAESTAIFGLVLFLVAGQRLDFYLFFIIALVYSAIFFPRLSKWEEQVKQ